MNLGLQKMLGMEEQRESTMPPGQVAEREWEQLMDREEEQRQKEEISKYFKHHDIKMLENREKQSEKSQRKEQRRSFVIPKISRDRRTEYEEYMRAGYEGEDEEEEVVNITLGNETEHLTNTTLGNENEDDDLENFYTPAKKDPH